MSTFVYMTRCDGCGHCVDICPSDIMHIDETIRRAKNIDCLLYTSPSPRDKRQSRMPASA